MLQFNLHAHCNIITVECMMQRSRMIFEANVLFEALVGSSDVEVDLDVNDGDAWTVSEILELWKLLDDAELDC